MVSYNQKAKKKVRNESLSQAIKLLTVERKFSTLAPRDYLRKMWNVLKESDSQSDKYYNSHLKPNTIDRWENFYDSVVGAKKPSELKIAYLCGPDPINDLNVLVECGVLPENVWAFESDQQLYESAVANALNSEFPFMKILSTDLKTFIEVSPIKFDLIYLDFCGPVYNRNKNQKNLATLSSIAKHQSLNNLGILLTNFSLPTEEQDAKGHNLLARLTASYLFPKAFVEEHKHDSKIDDGPICHSVNEESWDKKVKADLPNFYGQFVTRLIMDIFTYLVPMDRFMSNEKYLKTFFKVYNSKGRPRYILKKRLSFMYDFSKNGGGGDVIVDPGYYSSMWTFAAYKGIWDYTKEDKDFIKHGELFLEQMAQYSSNHHDFFGKITAYQFLMNEGLEQYAFYTDSLKTISDKWRENRKYQFCDMFLFHQIKDLLVRQISVPYQVNVEKTRRWTYQAKETKMFTDMIVLDECRYMYDWMPTIDMLEQNLQNIEHELSFRYVADALGKHNRWYQEEVFSGMAVIDMDEQGFKVKAFEERIAY